MSTPETDDLARGNHVVPVEWAQQLERERDEAVEEVRLLKGILDVLKKANDFRELIKEAQ